MATHSVFLSEESCGQRNLEGYSHRVKRMDMTEATLQAMGKKI